MIFSTFGACGVLHIPNTVEGEGVLERRGKFPEDAVAQNAAWSDATLVQGCLDGNEHAWSALIEKYKNLIYSIPIRQGFNQDDATDIFQSVAVQLLTELSQLRDPEALAAWLIRTTWRKCNRWRQLSARVGQLPDEGAWEIPQPAEPPESLLDAARRERLLTEIIKSSSPQCRQLVEMLFFEDPARPYTEVAEQLGIAPGSIGFIRRKCLDRLKASLAAAGFV